MLRRNIGRADRILRLVGGVTLLAIGLVALGGWQGTLIGIVAVVFALLLLVTGVTGFCPGYVPFGLSTTPDEPPPRATHSHHDDLAGIS